MKFRWILFHYWCFWVIVELLTAEALITLEGALDTSEGLFGEASNSEEGSEEILSLFVVFCTELSSVIIPLASGDDAAWEIVVSDCNADARDLVELDESSTFLIDSALLDDSILDIFSAQLIQSQLHVLFLSKIAFWGLLLETVKIS